MKNNEALKKHHFWILLGLVPLFVLIALVVISSSVGGAIEKREGEIETEKKNIASKTAPKSKALLDEMEKMTKKVDGKKGNLHEANWERQKNLFTWPTSNLFKNLVVKVKVDDKDKEIRVARLEDVKFGDVIVNTEDQFGEFRKDSFYRSLYSDAGTGTPGKNGMADRVAPTQFNGGWQSILRYVNSWSEIKPTSEQIWLLMEDVWVQRSLLEAVKAVNDQMSEFSRVKYEKAPGQVIDDPDGKNGPTDPLRRKFRSRTWEVSLEVARKGNKQYITGTLENITERLQVLGIGKTLTLRVWLEGNTGPDGKLKLGPDGKPDVKDIEPIEFRIGSEFLPGKGGPMKEITDKEGKKIQVLSNVVSIKPDENNDKDLDKYPNLIPPGKNVVEIVKVEQVFDTQTVPIRRIDALALGKVDSRYGDAAQLEAAALHQTRVTRSPARRGRGGRVAPGAEDWSQRSDGSRWSSRPPRGWYYGWRWSPGEQRDDRLGRHREPKAVRRSHAAGPPDAGRDRGGGRSGVHPGCAHGLRQLAVAIPDHAGFLEAFPGHQPRDQHRQWRHRRVRRCSPHERPRRLWPGV